MYKGTDEQTYGGEESVVTTLDPDSNTQMNANANANVRPLGVNGDRVLGVYEMSGGEYLEEKNSNIKLKVSNMNRCTGEGATW